MLKQHSTFSIVLHAVTPQIVSPSLHMWKLAVDAEVVAMSVRRAAITSLPPEQPRRFLQPQSPAEAAPHTTKHPVCLSPPRSHPTPRRWPRRTSVDAAGEECPLTTSVGVSLPQPRQGVRLDRHHHRWHEETQRGSPHPMCSFDDRIRRPNWSRRHSRSPLQPPRRRHHTAPLTLGTVCGEGGVGHATFPVGCRRPLQYRACVFRHVLPSQ
mmetsp:Transcript_60232/g.130796  ORF Transcript_60232/g.130796 Transcript_60232/m.130796 type:complete len:211 (-) Transcript_60232:763-1395(-)